MPRFRFTVRRMMLAVAIAGLIVGAVTLRTRSVRYRRLGELYDDLAISRMMQYADDVSRPGARTKGETPGLQNMRNAQRDRGLSRKYWAASSSPWLSVSPDPPYPE